MKEIDDSYKPAYAGFLLENPEPFQAAMKLCDGDTGLALWVANNWQYDEVVLAEMQRLIDSGAAEERLPGKAELLLKVWAWIDLPGKMDDKLKAARLYAEIRDFLPQKNTPAVAVNVAQPSVMVVNNFGSDDNWEQALKEQQRELIANNVAPTQH